MSIFTEFGRKKGIIIKHRHSMHNCQTRPKSYFLSIYQGCSQDVKSQDRDETETVNPQDRDETETFHFPKLSRPRRDQTFNLQDRDETRRSKKRLETVSRPRRSRPRRSRPRLHPWILVAVRTCSKRAQTCLTACL